MRKVILYIILVAAWCSACSSLNCPLNNTVASVWRFDKPIPYYLSVIADIEEDTDSVLVNMNTKNDSLAIPLSKAGAADAFTLLLEDAEGNQAIGKITVHKTNTQHFESIECSPNVFHRIENVEYEGYFIDSVKVINPTVDYNTNSANIVIYTSFGDN